MNYTVTPTQFTGLKQALILLEKPKAARGGCKMWYASRCFNSNNRKRPDLFLVLFCARKVTAGSLRAPYYGEPRKSAPSQMVTWSTVGTRVKFHAMWGSVNKFPGGTGGDPCHFEFNLKNKGTPYFASVREYAQLPQTNRPFELLLFPFVATIVRHGPQKVITFSRNQKHST